jgi:hypothetical protein
LRHSDTKPRHRSEPAIINRNTDGYYMKRV